MNRGNRIRAWGVLLITACLIPCLVGCDTMQEYTVTGRLWDTDLSASHHLPATNSNLKLSQTPDNRDVLVEYDEGYENNDRITRRAFLLHQNEKKIDERRRPHFVSRAKANKLRATPIRIYSETNEVAGETAQMYAVVSTDGTSFKLVTGGFENGPYALPVYFDSGARAGRIALTPLTVACDLTIYTAAVATVVGIIAVYWYAQGNRTWQPK